MANRTGIIGGSGLYDIDGVKAIDRLNIDTPYGKPSDQLLLARINGHEAVFLPRHGRGHAIPPHKINYRANIYAMKLAGVDQIISVSAVGSLQENIEPGHFVLVDQFIDRTNGRASTFFDGPVVAHASMADPVCNRLRSNLTAACRKAGITVHEKGNYLAMQGPQFSSRAESLLYRSWGMDVIGMTNIPEAKLAREAEICYATVAMSTDYDCWHADEEDVSISNVLAVMQANVQKARQLLTAFFDSGDVSGECGCHKTLEHAILSDLSIQDDAAIKPVHALVERFL
jgi:5'-methylthioadenosine phosphorylase